MRIIKFNNNNIDSRCPKICKTSFDSGSANFFKEFYTKLVNIYYDNKINTFDDFIKTIIEKLSSYLNSKKIKSLILYYLNDLENRTSFLFKQRENSQFIQYDLENSSFDIKIFFDLVSLNTNYENFENIFETNFLKNNDFKQFLTFLNYSSENNFVEIFIFLIISSLKYEMLKYNKFNIELFNKNKAFCGQNIKDTIKAESANEIDVIKMYKTSYFNKCKCYIKNNEDISRSNKLNNCEEIENIQNENSDSPKCLKILLIEMENIRYHLGLY